jgi:hypothetical protein
MSDEQRGHELNVLLGESRFGAEHGAAAFDDGALERRRLHGDVLGKEARQRAARAGFGIQTENKRR